MIKIFFSLIILFCILLIIVKIFKITKENYYQDSNCFKVTPQETGCQFLQRKSNSNRRICTANDTNIELELDKDTVFNLNQVFDGHRGFTLKKLNT